MNILKHKSRMVKVTDDWHPCCNGNCVILSISLIHFIGCKCWNDHYMIKLSAWGDDDRGVEIETNCNSIKDAYRIYENQFEIYKNIPDGVDMHWFYANGFYPA